ncbi:DNA polymerase I [Gammaproteobacteria bacterium LSUCC0057]|uniref:DNA polymerase I n=1 Tax=Gammaproteobacteria bacterium LSUCC0057 TaxID=2559237 RepID=A0A4Y8UIC7_9GAMM|nr:DNA polymerase I [Gammaproteobacteria bacterium LSUCC0057]
MNSNSATPGTAPLVLVDGSSYLYRAFHALPPLVTSTGQPSGAVRGVTSMLRALQRDYPASTIAVVFDAKGKTFRDDLYGDYKSHRPPMPDDLRAQIEPIHQIVVAMGLPMLIIDGVEADDVIGTLALQAQQSQLPVVISTGDKDMAQLVGPGITLVNTMSNTVLDSDGVRDKFGIGPELIIDYLALLGDKSDNIPGVPGVGEKTALALLQQLGGLDAIYADLPRVAELDFRGAKKMPEKLAEHRELAYLSYLLATIKVDVELPQSANQLANASPDQAALKALFSELEFKSWLRELEAGDSSPTAPLSEQGALLAPPAAVAPLQVETVLTEPQLQQWLDRLAQAELFAVDTETTSLNYMEAQLVGISLAVEPGCACYIPFGHDYLGAPPQLSRERVLAALQPLLEDPALAKVGQNIKYDMSVFAEHGIELAGVAFDTMLESYVLDSVASRHDMDSLARHYLNTATTAFSDIAGKGASQLTFNQIALEQAAPYAAEDADITLRLHRQLWPAITAQPSLQQLFETIELPLVAVLSKIERNGALIDRQQLQRQSAELSERLAELQDQAWQLAGQEFNLSSPKQLGEILFDKLNIPVLKKTAKGAASTKEEVLAELALEYPLPKVILQHRGLAKLKSTYTDKLPTMVNARTGRLHTSYHQAGTATGRLSSSDPNLQNIPIRTEEGRRVRQAFVAAPGSLLLAADYSQIELRIMAELSADAGLRQAFADGLDIHSATAAEVFGVELEAVTGEMRRSAKAINFGLIYGMSAFGLARQLQIGRKQAQEYIDRYFQRYPGVQDFMQSTRTSAADRGYVETLFGRRLYLPEINDRNAMRRQAAERTAINAPLQGSAADLIKIAMLKVDSWLTEQQLHSKIIMQVHDELVLEVPADELETVRNGVRQLMEGAAALSVPLIVDIGVGASWDEAH